MHLVPFGLATLIGVSLGACTVSVGSGDGSDPFDGGSLFDDTGTKPAPSQSATNNPPPSTGDVACNGCLFQSCSAQHSVCQSNAECLAIYQCATKAGCTGTCVNDCFAAHPTGQSAYTALYTCDQQATCGSCNAQCKPAASSCPTPTEQDAAVPEQDATTAPLSCNECSQTRCANESAACAPQSDCDQFSSCILACNDAACSQVCVEAHPEGKKASDALATCTEAQCKTECSF